MISDSFRRSEISCEWDSARVVPQVALLELRLIDNLPNRFYKMLYRHALARHQQAVPPVSETVIGMLSRRAATLACGVYLATATAVSEQSLSRGNF